MKLKRAIAFAVLMAFVTIITWSSAWLFYDAEGLYPAVPVSTYYNLLLILVGGIDVCGSLVFLIFIWKDSPNLVETIKPAKLQKKTSEKDTLILEIRDLEDQLFKVSGDKRRTLVRRINELKAKL